MTAKRGENHDAVRWLLLIHQLPPTPAYLRVKIGRRLVKLGAVAIKNSVYALPRNETAREDFEWVLREIEEGGGDAYVCEARFVEGLSDAHVESMFSAARDEDYGAVSDEARALGKSLPRRGVPDEATRTQAERDVARLRRRMAEIAAVDFFGATRRESADAAIRAIEARLREPRPDAEPESAATPTYHARTWVTRKGIHVDRMASAWLIRRFIDPQATFRFVSVKEYQHADGELRFDMFDAEFTHEGESCSFEVLARRAGVTDAAVRAIGEVIHDLDLKVDRFARPETAGVGAALTGISWAHGADEARMEAANAFFDALYEFFRRRRATAHP